MPMQPVTVARNLLATKLSEQPEIKEYLMFTICRPASIIRTFNLTVWAHVPEPPGPAPDQEPEIPPPSTPDEGIDLPPREIPSPVRDPEQPIRATPRQ